MKIIHIKDSILDLIRYIKKDLIYLKDKYRGKNLYISDEIKIYYIWILATIGFLFLFWKIWQWFFNLFNININFFFWLFTFLILAIIIDLIYYKIKIYIKKYR